jgi:hypothetical protein
MLKSLRHAGVLRLALVGAVLAGFLMALALATSSALHERIHHDADQPEHQCLATAIGCGGCVDAPTAPTLTAFVAVLSEIAPKDRSRVVESPFLSCGVLEHAPPVIP